MAEMTVPMEIRIAIQAFLLVDGGSMTVKEFCARHDISRDTFYRYQARIQAEGLEGLLPRSRRPKSSPNATPAAMVEVLLAEHARLTAEGFDAGARSIHNWLEPQGIEGLPSPRTIHKILRDHGLVERTPAKRPRSSYRRFEADAPNGMWQIDATGWHLADGQLVAIVRVIDDHSRMILATVAAERENFVALWACTEQALSQHGRPVLMLSDNGGALSAKLRHGGAYSEYELRLAQLGVAHITSSPYHPQTCGKKEREWQPLKRWLRARPTPGTLDELQLQLDSYDVIFNTLRRHQGIGNQTPQQRYQATPKATPAQTVPPRSQIHSAHVHPHGRIRVNSLTIAIGSAWTGATVQYLLDGDHVVIFSGNILIRQLTLDRSRNYQPLPGRELKPKKPIPSNP
jgi:transposase InsO family protein